MESECFLLLYVGSYAYASVKMYVCASNGGTYHRPRAQQKGNRQRAGRSRRGVGTRSLARTLPGETYNSRNTTFCHFNENSVI